MCLYLVSSLKFPPRDAAGSRLVKGLPCVLDDSEALLIHVCLNGIDKLVVADVAVSVLVELIVHGG